MRPRVWIALVGFAVLATASVVILTSNRVDASQFRVLESSPGTGPLVLLATVQLPDGVSFEGERGRKLRLVAEDGQELLLQSRFRPGNQVRIQVPGGYPNPPGVARLQIVDGARTLAETRLGPLPFRRNQIDTSKHPAIEATFVDGSIVVRVQQTVGQLERVSIRPVRSENYAYSNGDFVILSRIKGDLYEASLELPYANLIRHLELEVKQESYEPDEFSFEGASLEAKDGVPHLRLKESILCVSKFGREITVPKKHRLGEVRQRIAFLDFQIESGDYPRRIRSPEVEPNLWDRGVQVLTVMYLGPKVKPVQAAFAGGGFLVPEDPPVLLHKPIKVGPIGRLTVRMYFGDRSKSLVQKVAIPVVQIASPSKASGGHSSPGKAANPGILQLHGLNYDNAYGPSR